MPTEANAAYHVTRLQWTLGSSSLARVHSAPIGERIVIVLRRGVIPQLIAQARIKGVADYIGEGTSRWPAVLVKDAATLYRAAIERAPAGAVLNAVGDEGVAVREIAEAIGRQLNIPAESLPADEFDGMFVRLLSTDMPASSVITQELLGWKPTHPGLIEDIEQGHYFL